MNETWDSIGRPDMSGLNRGYRAGDMADWVEKAAVLLRSEDWLDRIEGSRILDAQRGREVAPGQWFCVVSRRNTDPNTYLSAKIGYQEPEKLNVWASLPTEHYAIPWLAAYDEVLNHQHYGNPYVFFIDVVDNPPLYTVRDPEADALRAVKAVHRR